MIRIFFAFFISFSLGYSLSDANLTKEEKKIIEQTNQQIEQSKKTLNSTFENDHQKGYAIQLASIYVGAKNEYNSFLRYLKEPYRSNIFVAKIGSYYAIRYSFDKSYKKQKELLKSVIDDGFTKAFIVQTSYQRYIKQKEQIKKQVKKIKKDKNDAYTPDDISGYEFACVDKQTFKFDPLNSYEFADTLNDANIFKKNNELEKSIKMYEKLFGHKQTNTTINNNLFYLYGITNNWPKASEKMCLIKDQSKVLYSYALGALEINNPMIEDDLINFLNADKTGYTHLALAVYFERNDDINKAYLYYQKAYNTNRYDMYLAYAYARVCEIKEDYKKALFLYRNIANNKQKKYEQLKNYSTTRYQQLRSLLQTLE